MMSQQTDDSSVLRCCVCLTDDKEAIARDILFFCFPPASMGKLLDRWLRALRFSGNEEGLDKLLICSKHFEASCFDEHRRLVDNSVPTIFEEDIPCLVLSSDDDQDVTVLSPVTSELLSSTEGDHSLFSLHPDTPPVRREDQMDRPYPHHIPKLIPTAEKTSIPLDCSFPRPWEVNTPDDLVDCNPVPILGDPEGSLPPSVPEVKDEDPDFDIVDGFLICSFSTKEAMDAFQDSALLGAIGPKASRKTSSSSTCTLMLDDDDDHTAELMESSRVDNDDDDVVELPIQDPPVESFRQEDAKDLQPLDLTLHVENFEAESLADRNHLITRTRHNTEELTEEARQSNVSVILEDVFKKKTRSTSAIHQKVDPLHDCLQDSLAAENEALKGRLAAIAAENEALKEQLAASRKMIEDLKATLNQKDQLPGPSEPADGRPHVGGVYADVYLDGWTDPSVLDRLEASTASEFVTKLMDKMFTEDFLAAHECLDIEHTKAIIKETMKRFVTASGDSIGQPIKLKRKKVKTFISEVLKSRKADKKSE